MIRALELMSHGDQDFAWLSTRKDLGQKGGRKAKLERLRF